jgi:hypothetical protein
MRIIVTNTQKNPVSRLGYTFKKGEPKTIDVTPREYKAIKACRVLEVQIVPTAIAETPRQKPKAPSKGKGIGKEPKNETEQEFACPVPGCDFISKSQVGLMSHIRAKHPEYNEDQKTGESTEDQKTEE